MRTSHGALTFLPAFARRMRVLKLHDREALVLFGAPETADSSFPSPHHSEYACADFCELSSRKGSVIVGVADEDAYTSSGVGIWKKIGEFFLGGE